MNLAYMALNRFGLGAGPGDARLPELADPKKWLLEQIGYHFLGNADPNDYTISHTPADGAAYTAEVLRRSPWTGQMSVEVPDQKAANGWNFGNNLKGQWERKRLERAIDTPHPFVERLMHFWSNHFAVHAGEHSSLNIGGHEFVNIRKNMFGSFAELVMAATAASPAMCIYLTQWNSLGMNSKMGGGRKVMNENLGREILELHVLGVDAGYTQEDVQEMSKVLTGFTFNGFIRGTTPNPNVRLGTPIFLAEGHEPGEKRVFNHIVVKEGVEGLRDLLYHLTTTPQCAYFVCRKLLVHFFADEPPASMVETLAKEWLRTGGNLPDVYYKLVEVVFDNLGDMQPKYLSSFEFAVRVGKLLRGNGVTNFPQIAHERNIYGISRGAIWSPGSPAGYPDVKNVVTSGEVLSRFGAMQYEMGKLTPRLPADFDISDIGLSAADQQVCAPLTGFARFQAVTTSASFLFR